MKADGSGVDLANIKMSMNPFDAIALDEAPGLVVMGNQAIDDDSNQTGQMRVQTDGEQVTGLTHFPVAIGQRITSCQFS